MNRKPLRNCVIPKHNHNGVRTLFFNVTCPCRVPIVDLNFQRTWKEIQLNSFTVEDMKIFSRIEGLEAL